MKDKLCCGPCPSNTGTQSGGRYWCCGEDCAAWVPQKRELKFDSA